MPMTAESVETTYSALRDGIDRQGNGRESTRTIVIFMNIAAINRIRIQVI